MSKCLVTGGAGFIGSHVVDLLIDGGHEVNVIDNLSTGHEYNLNVSAETHFIDIKDRIGVSYVFGRAKPEYVFHLASLARIQPSIEDPLPAHDVNLTGSLNILEASREYNSKVIFSSSSSIYKGDELPTHEDSAKEPKNPYALQKYMVEQYIELYRELYSLDVTILRYFNVFGERQILSGAYAAVIGIFLDRFKKNESLLITNDGEQRRDFTYVLDVAKANVMAMKWDNRAFNIGTGKNISINELADLFPNEKTYIGDVKGEVTETLADNKHAVSKGWSPDLDIKSWVEEELAKIKDSNENNSKL